MAQAIGPQPASLPRLPGWAPRALRCASGSARHGGKAWGPICTSAPMVSPVRVPQLRCDLVHETASSQQETGLSAEFLHHFCETSDLSLVTQLDIQVDSVQQNIELLGEHLRNLRQLRLTDSSVLCLRDLGTDLSGLEILWMSRCGLQDLGGAASALQSLRELYIPFNDISDLSPLSGHERIEVLDLEGNAVAELDEVAGLSLCPQLRELTLRGNPLCRGTALIRATVRSLLPELAILDDASIELSADPNDLAGHEVFNPDAEADLEMLVHGRGDGGARAGCHGVSNQSQDPHGDQNCYGGDGLEPIQPLHPSHPLLARGLLESQRARASRPYGEEPDEDELVVEGLKRARPRLTAPHAFTARPTVGSPHLGVQLPDRRQVRTAGSEPASSRPATASSSRLNFDDLKSSQDSASGLTCGAPLAGGPLVAVRQRRSQGAGGRDAEPEQGIRELLRRYRTYTQPSCIPAEELLHRKREADGKRPGTPDVRIHAPASLQASGSSRGATSAGLDMASRARPSSSAGADGAPSSTPTLERRRDSGSTRTPRLPPAPEEGGAVVVPPSLITRYGEALFIEDDLAVDLE
uniref:Leucine-rich repeat-containing protein 56 n=1 Tax=Alexandrium catenella TaxID=2925 RepID=A0A7S1M7M1_ALECA